MRIEKLIVRKTKPSDEIIREIKFRAKGLNLIVDDTPEAERESGNSVGKSTAIKIIDLCLGAKSPRELYYDSDTRSENEEIKDFIQENKVQAELVLLDDSGHRLIIKRDLFPRGKKYIFDTVYNEIDFWNELKRRIFGLEEEKPTFRQMIPKFIRLENTAEDRMIKYLPMMTTNDTYDLVYCFLFQIYSDKLISRRGEISEKLSACQKTVQALEKSKSIVSLSVLKQSLEIVNDDLEKLEENRKKLSYMEKYRARLDSKRQITSQINELQEEMQFLQFEIDTIDKSISKLTKERREIDVTVLSSIYEEAQCYLPDLQKSFEDMISFHNSMIQNRIDFISSQLAPKKQMFNEKSMLLDKLLEEREKETIEALDEGLLDELNLLNKQIEELSLRKGEIQQSINLLEEQESIRNELMKELADIETKMESDGIEEKIKRFNQIFADYCEKLYGEKYLLAYNANWKEEGKFPITIASLGGQIGTGKKKAVIVAYDLAYMQYSISEGITVPKFVIHDKMENTHINQLRTIFQMCDSIEGQYIIPILRERVDKIDDEYIQKAKILELSSADKFFGV